jgi:hypothetical protein
MPERNKQLIMLICAFAGLLFLAGALINDYMHARQFVRHGVEKQGTILTLERVISSRAPVSDYVYSLQIDKSVIVKKFPYNWLLPRERSFLVLSDSPGPDDIALGNQNSSSLTVLCYMEGCDMPDRQLFYAVCFAVCIVVFPLAARRVLKNRETD